MKNRSRLRVEPLEDRLALSQWGVGHVISNAVRELIQSGATGRELGVTPRIIINEIMPPPPRPGGVVVTTTGVSTAVVSIISTGPINAVPALEQAYRVAGSNAPGPVGDMLVVMIGNTAGTIPPGGAGSASEVLQAV